MKKQFKRGMISIVGGLVIAGCICWGIWMPKKDRIQVGQLPDEYFIVNEDNYVAFQSGSDCSGYAAAYVLRHLGIQADGPELYEEMPRFLGRVSMGCIRSKLKDYGYNATSYYGTIDTLKKQLTKGTPVIAFITTTIGNHQGHHYVAVVGYDEDYLYLADSTGRKTNISGNKQYNRRVTYDEFETLWLTKVYPMKNLYTVIA